MKIKSLVWSIPIFCAITLAAHFLTPGNRIADALSVNDVSKKNFYSSIIIGSGVGGLTAAIYLGHAGAHPLVIEGRNAGGLLADSHSVRNWPGEENITGSRLVQKMTKHALHAGAIFEQSELLSINTSVFPYAVTVKKLDTGKKCTYKTAGIILALGSSPRKLNVPGEQEYWGKGVSNCAICDGGLYKDKTVAVVGGGEASILEVDYLSHIAKKVYWIVRSSKLRAQESDDFVQRVLNRPVVKQMINTAVTDIVGQDNKVTHLNVRATIGLKAVGLEPKKKMLAVDGVFEAIGSDPNSDLLKDVIECDEDGFIKVSSDQETTVKGIYAVGDVTRGHYRQATIVAGQATLAALNLCQRLKMLNYFDLAARLKGNQGTVPILAEQTVTHEEPVVSKSKSHIEVKAIDELRTLIKTKPYVFLDCFAPWCGPCKRMKPIIEKIASDKRFEHVTFVMANVDEVSGLRTEVAINGIPKFVLYANGKEIKNHVGAMPQVELEQWLKEAFNK